jgi:hypothetical protein
MAENHRAPGADVVYEALAVFAFQPGTLGALDKQWIAAYARKSANRRVNAAGDDISCIGKVLLIEKSLGI